MSYIVSATTYDDPTFALIGMDLADLQSIYETKITNYLEARKTAKTYYDWVEEKVNYSEAIYDTTMIASMICYNGAETDNILSCMPLFMYLTCYTEDWTKGYTVDVFEKIIENYKNNFTVESFYEYINSQNLKDYIGLWKFVEDNTPTSDDDTVTQFSFSEDDTFFTYFSTFWKTSCILTVTFPAKEKSLTSVSTLSKSAFFGEEEENEEEESDENG